MSDVQILLFLFVAILSIVCIILNTTSLFSRYARQKAVFLFAGDVIATSAVFFLVMSFMDPVNTGLLIAYAFFYLGLIYYKSSRFISSGNQFNR